MKLKSKTRVARLRSALSVVLGALICLELVLLAVKLQKPLTEAAVHVRTGSVALQPAMPSGSGPAAPELTFGADGAPVVAHLSPPPQPGSGPAAHELTDAEIRGAREQGLVH